MSALRGWGVAFLGYVAVTTGASAAAVLSPAIVATGAWPHRHVRERCRQRSRHPLRPQASHRDGHAGLHSDRRNHRLRRQHVLCRRRRADHHLRHRHLARLLVAHGGNSRHGRAFAARRDARRAFHARLCGRLCRPVAGRLDPRSVRRDVASRLGIVVPLGGRADGSGAHHVLGDPAARARGRRAKAQ